MSKKRPLLQRVFAFAALLRNRVWLAYATCLGIFGASLYARLHLMDDLPVGFPFLTFFPAVILTAFFCGTRPGILCAVLSGVASWAWFISPGRPFSTSGSDLLALAFYAFIVAVDIALIHYMQRSSRRLRRDKRVIGRLYDQQNFMFTELQHRVANNMQFISSILYVGRQHVQRGADALEVLNDAQQRLQIISRIHRRLYDPSRADLPASACLTELCHDLLSVNGQGHIRCIVEPSEVRLDLTRLTTLSMLVAELVTNALKHAFAPDRPGTIVVSLEALPLDTLRLRVADDGKGFAGPEPAATRHSLGLKIIGSFAAQLGATPVWRNDNGTVVEVVLPARVDGASL
ncbi:histidine kinase dimerization/phosphoacceptor domain -containing protein [Pseudomonas syringae]